MGVLRGAGGSSDRSRAGRAPADLGATPEDPGLLLQGHRALGDTLCCLGELVAARTHLEQGIALYDGHQHHRHAFLYGQDPGMGCLVLAALTLWYLGFPDQAVQRGHEALTLMRDCRTPLA